MDCPCSINTNPIYKDLCDRLSSLPFSQLSKLNPEFEKFYSDLSDRFIQRLLAGEEIACSCSEYDDCDMFNTIFLNKLKLHPDSPGCLYYAGLWSEDKREREAYFDKAAKLGSVDALFYLGEIRKDPDLGLEALKKGYRSSGTYYSCVANEYIKLLKEYIVELELAPGGPIYLQAKAHFEGIAGVAPECLP